MTWARTWVTGWNVPTVERSTAVHVRSLHVFVNEISSQTLSCLDFTFRWSHACLGYKMGGPTII